MKKILVTYAVQEEFVPVSIKNAEITFVCTGIGKTKSAMKLTEAICNNRPDLVLNMGTAGSIHHKVGDIFICNNFIDRDFQRVKLPGIVFEIGFDADLEDEFICNFISQQKKVGTCNTGDSFVTEIESLDGDVVDMEAFAQAVVCKEFNLPLISVKYITDIIGQNSVQHWEDKLADARKSFEEWFANK